MIISLIGLPKCGKTTVFNALTKQNALLNAYNDKSTKPNLAIVDVIDERITKLASIYQPKKTIYASIEFMDFAGIEKGSGKEGIYSGEILSLLRTSDALAIVLRNFNDEISDSPAQPDVDINITLDELILADLIVIENRLERISNNKKRGVKTPEQDIEELTLCKFKACLENGNLLSILELSNEESKSIRGFQFFTVKPIMIILNSSENNYGKNIEVSTNLSLLLPVVELAGKFEMELSSLTPEEAFIFMEDMHITVSALNRLTNFAYKIIGMISFFTVGKDEVRAWTIKEGQNAVEAAGKIHSDLARGFIRAECFSYSDFIKQGSEKALRDQGLLRLEGKTYIVKDGDILNIRFSV